MPSMPSPACSAISRPSRARHRTPCLRASRRTSRTRLGLLGGRGSREQYSDRGVRADACSLGSILHAGDRDPLAPVDPLAREGSRQGGRRKRPGFRLRLDRVERVVSFTVVTNAPSRRLMQRLGMRKLGELDNQGLPEGHALRRNVVYEVAASTRQRSRDGFHGGTSMTGLKPLNRQDRFALRRGALLTTFAAAIHIPDSETPLWR